MLLNQLDSCCCSLHVSITFWWWHIYTVSVGSNWSEWTDVDPKTHLAEVVSLCRLLDPQKCIIVMGVSNMNSFVCLHSPIMLWTPEEGGRRNFVMRFRLSILNGIHCEKDSPDRYTCFQAHGSSVVDYIFLMVPFVSRSADNLKVLRVIPVDRSLSNHYLI